MEPINLKYKYVPPFIACKSEIGYLYLKSHFKSQLPPAEFLLIFNGKSELELLLQLILYNIYIKNILKIIHLNIIFTFYINEY